MTGQSNPLPTDSPAEPGREGSESPIFVCVDVETANPDPGSICQVGIAEFSGDGELLREWESLVNPEDRFDGFNVSIHGIDQEAVRGAPTYPAIANVIRSYACTGRITVSHTSFDRSAIGRVHDRYSLSPLKCKWLDSARVVRRTWKRFSKRGYGLLNVADELGISFRHHDALEDARAAGLILLKAVERSGLSVSDWLERVERPIHSDRASVRRLASEEGVLAGEVFCFTGALAMTRHEAADAVAELGGGVATTVTRKTTVLVVGDQDLRRLEGYKKSSKHRKAEERISAGHQIRILGEEGFEQLLREHNEQ